MKLLILAAAAALSVPVGLVLLALVAPILGRLLAGRGEVAGAPIRGADQACALTVGRRHPDDCRCRPCSVVVTELDLDDLIARARVDHLVWRACGGRGDTPAMTFTPWSIR